MKKIKTKKFTFSRLKAFLFISLFNADGGDGYNEEEIKKANDFIRENKLLSLVEVEDNGDQIECTFTLLTKEERTFLRNINILKDKKHAKQ